MRRVWVIVAALGLGAGLAWAQTAEQQPQAGQSAAQGRHAHGQRPAGAPEGDRGHGRMDGERLMARLTQELSLTQEQQDKIRKLLGDHREKMIQSFKQSGGSREKFTELRTQYQAAKAANDKDKMREIETQMRQLRAGSGMEGSREELVKGIEAVLTPEQATKFQGMKGELFGGPGGPADLQNNPRMLFMAVRSLNLPPEQMQRIEPIFKDAKSRMDANPDIQARKVVANDVYNTVMAQLTPEQQAKVKEFRPTGSDDHRHGQDGEKSKDKSDEAKARKEAKKLRKGGDAAGQQQPNQ